MKIPDKIFIFLDSSGTERGNGASCADLYITAPGTASRHGRPAVPREMAEVAHNLLIIKRPTVYTVQRHREGPGCRTYCTSTLYVNVELGWELGTLT